MHGAATDPTQGAPPTATAQIGQGCVSTPVSVVAEFSWKFRVAAPVPVLSVPLTGCENVFVTQTEIPALAIGNGVPKKQPVLVQS